MQDDPVRIVRAFRFAAELGFSIEDRTTALIQGATERLRDTAAERVRTELFKMLASARSAPLVHQMDELGVLPVLLPELAATKGVAQDARHHLNLWDHSVATLEQVEEILCHLERYFPSHGRAMGSLGAADKQLPGFGVAARHGVSGLRGSRSSGAPYSSHPCRYSRYRYLLASATLVIFTFSPSNSTFCPARSATVPRLTASVIGPALRKLPGDCSPPLTA